ncbi:MAG: NAD-dependent epimerase/dehydratase family protein [Myxococcota bacterium]
MRVLVLGGNRYIGLHLVFELARRGHDVTVLNSHEAPLPAGVRRLHGDRQQPGVLERVLGPQRDAFDAVFDNTSYSPKDVAPLIELFRGRVKHFVFTSSTAVYRRSFVQPVLESFRRHDPRDEDPRKAYGVGKVQVEDLLAAEHARSGFPFTTLRVGHTLGPMSPLASRDPVFFARLEQKRPVPIPGEGLPLVHLIHVADVASCMAAVIESESAIGQAYNVVGREAATVSAMIHLMGRAVGVEAQILHVPMEAARRAQPPLVHWGEALTGSVYFSLDKALRDLPFSPRFGLEDGYRDSYAWFVREGRGRYTFDFARDDALIAQFGGARVRR